MRYPGSGITGNMNLFLPGPMLRHNSSHILLLLYEMVTREISVQHKVENFRDSSRRTDHIDKRSGTAGSRLIT